MKSVIIVLVVFLVFGLSGCGKTPPPRAQRNNLLSGTFGGSNGIAVAVADMDGDDHADIVCATMDSGVKYFENDGKGNFFDRGVIIKDIRQIQSTGVAGHSLALSAADIDNDGISDIIIASEDEIAIHRNPVSQKHRQKHRK